MPQRAPQVALAGCGAAPLRERVRVWAAVAGMATSRRNAGRYQGGDGAAPVSFLVDLSLCRGGVHKAT
jgi:hypothetical protein